MMGTMDEKVQTGLEQMLLATIPATGTPEEIAHAVAAALLNGGEVQFAEATQGPNDNAYLATSLTGPELDNLLASRAGTDQYVMFRVTGPWINIPHPQ